MFTDVEIKTHIFDDYHQENMINLYGDLTDDDQICIQLEYIYDDYIAYGFDNVENKNTLRWQRGVFYFEHYFKYDFLVMLNLYLIQ